MMDSGGRCCADSYTRERAIDDDGDQLGRPLRSPLPPARRSWLIAPQSTWRASRSHPRPAPHCSSSFARRPVIIPSVQGGGRSATASSGIREPVRACLLLFPDALSCRRPFRRRAPAFHTHNPRSYPRRCFVDRTASHRPLLFPSSIRLRSNG